MIDYNNKVNIGIVAKPHGTKGQFIVRSENDLPEELFDSEFIFLEIDNSLVPYRIIEIKEIDQSAFRVELKFIESIEDVKKINGEKVFIESVVHKEDNIFQGFKIIDKNTKKEVGTIKQMAGNKMNPLFEIENEKFIPAANELIVEMSIENKVIIMDIPEGLLDI
jgi:16S rRNA processing protein RimM